MSILIKTMTNLPEHCYGCPCHDGESGYCQADKVHRCSFDRPFWCPLEKTESKSQERNCIFCDHYKDEYCDVLDMKPCYPEKGCDYFEINVINIQEIYEKVKDLSERLETLEKKIIEEKEKKIEKLKAELDYAKFRCSLPDINMNIKEKRHGPWWECKKCGKMIPYMANFCHECANELLGDQPKPFNPAESEVRNDKNNM